MKPAWADAAAEVYARPGTALMVAPDGGPLPAPRDVLRILAVDPGVGGGLACLIGGEVLRVWDMPVIPGIGGRRRDYDLPECWRIARECKPTVVAIEHVQVMPRGKIATASLARGVALWEAIAVGLGSRLERLAPKRWQGILGARGGEAGSLARARELFPGVELHLAKHSGRAAALLVGEACRRLLG